jgi:hypothetical protein
MPAVDYVCVIDITVGAYQAHQVSASEISENERKGKKIVSGRESVRNCVTQTSLKVLQS